MRKGLVILLVAFILAAAVRARRQPTGAPALPQPAAVMPTPGGKPRPPSTAEYFSPRDDLESIWVAHVKAATRSIHIACYGLSNKNIVEALKDAAWRRHVEVIVLEDHRQASLPADLHGELAASGGRIIIKRSRVLLHDKMGIFDGASTIIGSYNLSEGAEDQDNSDVVLENDPAQAARAEAAWEQMFARETGRSYSPGIDLPPITPQGQ